MSAAPSGSTPRRGSRRSGRSVLDVVEGYPRRQLNRMLFEDEDGTLVVTCYPEDQSALLVAAKQGATLGAVSIGVDRLARRIRDVKAR